jgi:hypothetical protein
MDSSNFEPTMPTTVAGLAALAARIDAEYRGALLGAVSALETVEVLRAAIKQIETLPWLAVTKDSSGADVLVCGGKNEQIREAQFLTWCMADEHHRELSGQLITALRDHRLAEAKVEATRETAKLIRALLYALSPEKGA